MAAAPRRSSSRPQTCRTLKLEGRRLLGGGTQSRGPACIAITPRPAPNPPLALALALMSRLCCAAPRLTFTHHNHPQVPDEVVVEMVKTRLAQKDVQNNGWLLDGYPRSASQAEAIEKEGIRPDLFLLIEVGACAALVGQVESRLSSVPGCSLAT